LRKTLGAILQYAKVKQLFKAAEVELDLGLSKNVISSALARLFAQKKLARFKLPKRTYGYSFVNRDASIIGIDVECGEAKFVREDLKRLKAAEVQARLNSRWVLLVSSSFFLIRLRNITKK
jgi:hypothetical protein